PRRSRPRPSPPPRSRPLRPRSRRPPARQPRPGTARADARGRRGLRPAAARTSPDPRDRPERPAMTNSADAACAAANAPGLPDDARRLIEIEDAIAKIRTQIATADLTRQRTARPIDPDWFHR